MIVLLLCMFIKVTMCFPDKVDPIVYYNYDDGTEANRGRADKTAWSTIFSKRIVPTRSHLRLFKGQVFSSFTDKPIRILDWNNIKVTEKPAVPSRSSSRKLLGPQELAGIREAIRQIMPNRKMDGLNSGTSSVTASEDASTAWFTMRNVAPSSVADKPSVTPHPSIDTPAEDLVSLGVATEIQDMTLATNEGTLYDDRDIPVPLYYNDNKNIGRQGKGQSLTATTATTLMTIKTKRSRRRKTTTTTVTTPKLDIPALLEIISNLTADYSMNLSMMLNKSLEKYSIPTCPTPTTSMTTIEETPPTTDAYANLTGTVMGKCFVCGLDAKELPRNSHCADAFAGDFLPLVPVDPTARARIAKFRKYCRWMNVPKYEINASDSRNMWGRWTGGCSVRWIDLNGIYTQRTCRNRHRAVMGNHFVSKRMAKLEMALQHIDNGCIISPVSSLVPLSRGISLYARFHACVCTGNWCNRAPLNEQWTSQVALFPIIMRALFIS